MNLAIALRRLKASDQSAQSLGRKRTGIMLMSGSVGVFLGLSLIGHSGIVLLGEMGIGSHRANPDVVATYGTVLLALGYFLGCLGYVLMKIWSYVAVLSLRVEPDGLRQTMLGLGTRHLRWSDITEIRQGFGRTVVTGNASDDTRARKVLIPALAMKDYRGLLSHVQQNVSEARR
jgi:hypothetical protein